MLNLPLKIEKGHLAESDKIARSIDALIEQIITTPQGSCKSDPEFGFMLSALRFEIINEKEGVVYNSAVAKAEETDDLGKYTKKITGNSKNINTFAADLRDSISKYETRLTDINVAMTYRREDRAIYVVVKGIIEATKAKYEYKTSLKVWN